LQPERCLRSLINSGFNFTFGRTTIDLAPADVKKARASFDLPIALDTRAEDKVGVLLPAESAAEAAVVSGSQVIAIHKQSRLARQGRRHNRVAVVITKRARRSAEPALRTLPSLGFQVALPPHVGQNLSPVGQGLFGRG
jgi:magnesium chelatase family protein